MFYIYKITNLTNNKEYVGQTTKLPHKRLKFYFFKSQTKHSLISKSIQKYGKENHKFEIIDVARDLETLNKLEIKYIDKFETLHPKGYNLHTGGNNHKTSALSKQRMSEAKKGRIPWNKGKKELQNAWNKGIFNTSNSKLIKRIDLKTNEIKIYKSSMDAKREGFNSGHVIQCCRGKLKQHKGYKWEYENV